MVAPEPPRLRMRVGFLLVCDGEVTFLLFASAFLVCSGFVGSVDFDGNSIRAVRLSVLDGAGAFDDSERGGAGALSTVRVYATIEQCATHHFHFRRSYGSLFAGSYLSPRHPQAWDMTRRVCGSHSLLAVRGICPPSRGRLEDLRTGQAPYRRRMCVFVSAS